MLKTYGEMEKGSGNYIVILILVLLQPTNVLAFEYLHKEKLVNFGNVTQSSKLSMTPFFEKCKIN